MMVIVSFSYVIEKKNIFFGFFPIYTVKELCESIEKCQQLIALRLEGNTINEEAATAIGKALEKHNEIEVNNFFVQT